MEKYIPGTEEREGRMKHVSIPKWLLFVLCALALAGCILAAVVWTGDGDTRERVEQLQSQLHAAQDAQRITSGQLIESARYINGAGEAISASMVGLESGQDSAADLGAEIEHGAEIAGQLGQDVKWIGEFIERIESINKETEW